MPAGDFERNLGRHVHTIGYLVCLKHVYTSKNEPMCFGTFLDKEGAFMDTVHFPASLMKYPFMKSGFYIMEGKVMEEFGVYTLDVHMMRKIGYFEDKAPDTGVRVMAK
jgi:DNA polymerase-3 subunit alpha